jgi:hypothetical protein
MAHYKTLFPTLYLAAHDLGGKDVPLTIRRIVVEELKTEAGTEKKPVVFFVETGKKADAAGTKEKRLVLNKTNAKVIANMYGPELNDWTGKRVTLYAARVSSFGEEVDAIRVRPVPPPAAAQPKPQSTEETAQ